MSQEKTSLFNLKDLDTKLTRTTLNEVYEALEERG